MKNEAFPSVSKIQYEGPASKNPLAFRHYNRDQLVTVNVPGAGPVTKTMAEWLRFSMAFWHTLRGSGSDPFGPGTMLRPWESGNDDVQNAQNRVRVAFEFMEKCQIPFFAFHDRDIAPEGKTLAETNKNLDAVVPVIEEEMGRTGIGLLWGTANLFSNPRYMHGAATSPNADAFAFAAAQVKKALEVTHKLGGAGYTFWGGREGYQILLNTDMKRELENLARLMHMASDYAKQIGFTGQFYIEPKPKEPTKHQYDFDVAAVANFLRAYDLLDILKTNIETNHATLAGHTVEHELEYAAIQGLLGSVDANTGDLLLGWDTDQFPVDRVLTTLIVLPFLRNGGFAPGGVNFDAKVRRESFEPLDLFYAHIGGMDAFAYGLKAAAAILESGELDQMRAERYASWEAGVGAEITAGKHTLATLEKYMLEKGDITPNASGRQELFENVLARSVESVK